jgi:PIN domain nuclease of toxin-antitoxin system
MTVLLDTHAFIWWDENPQNLGPKARAACQDSANEIVLSVASIWEIQLKQMLGKLSLRKPLRELLQEQVQRNGLHIQSIDTQPVLELSTLPFHHRDPFDRL